MNPIDAPRDERESPQVDASQWTDRPTTDLVDHVIGTYHARLRRDVPRLIDTARKVEQLHSDAPRGLADILIALWSELQTHLMKEEQVLFPLLKAGRRGPIVTGPVHMMVYEHDAHTEQLDRIRSLARDFVPPPRASAAWTELYRGLRVLDAALREHMDFENDVLFPRAEP